MNQTAIVQSQSGVDLYIAQDLERAIEEKLKKLAESSSVVRVVQVSPVTVVPTSGGYQAIVSMVVDVSPVYKGGGERELDAAGLPKD